MDYRTAQGAGEAGGVSQVGYDRTRIRRVPAGRVMAAPTPWYTMRSDSALAALASLLGCLTGEPACAQGREGIFGPFEKPALVNPAITPNPASAFRSPMNDSSVHWEGYATFNPAAVVKDGTVYVLYRAEDATGEMKVGGHTSRIGLAESQDGLRFTRRSAPVLYPEHDAQTSFEWPGGVEDPRIVEVEDRTYVLTYTQWNRDIPRLAIATSRDLVTWTKHGPAFAKVDGGKYLNLESKSGAILSRVEGNRVIAAEDRPGLGFQVQVLPAVDLGE